MGWLTGKLLGHCANRFALTIRNYVDEHGNAALHDEGLRFELVREGIPDDEGLHHVGELATEFKRGVGVVGQHLPEVFLAGVVVDALDARDEIERIVAIKRNEQHSIAVDLDKSPAHVDTALFGGPPELSGINTAA